MKNPAIPGLIELLYPDAVAPTRATEHSAGYDVSAYLNGRVVSVMHGGRWHEFRMPTSDATLILGPGMRALVPLGFKATLPPHVVAKLYIRSSLAFKKGAVLGNGVGIIDADYPDEWLAMVVNTDPENLLVIHHGERIAQVVFQTYETVDFAHGVVGVTTDRVGGVGSTGA